MLMLPISDHLFLQLAELRGHGLQTDSGLLELLVGCSNQVAAPVRRQTSVIQLTERNKKVENEHLQQSDASSHFVLRFLIFILRVKLMAYLGIVGLLYLILVHFDLQFVLVTHLHQRLRQLAFKVLLVPVIQLHHTRLMAPLCLP